MSGGTCAYRIKRSCRNSRCSFYLTAFTIVRIVVGVKRKRNNVFVTVFLERVKPNLRQILAVSLIRADTEIVAVGFLHAERS